MNKAELKRRAELIDDRIIALARKYPLVFITVVLVSGLLVFVLVKWVL